MPKKNPETFQKIIDYINAYVADNGSTPTTREIAAGIGLAKSSVPKYLAAMEADGRIAYDAHRRPLTRQMQEDMNDLTRSPFRVSVVGSIACGGPNEEEEYIEESVRLPKKIFGNGPLFILHARGESMIEAGIDDGDLVVIRQQPTAKPGDIVVALTEDGNTLKGFFPEPEKHRFRLQPANHSMEPMYYKDVQIQGVAVKVIKSAQIMDLSDW